jgi:gas vesicle protein
MRTRDVMELIAGLGFGAAMMYLIDPDMGRKRRKRLAKQAGHALEETGEYLGEKWQDVSGRARQFGHDVADYYSDYSADAREAAEDMAERAKSYARSGYSKGRSYYKSYRPSRAKEYYYGGKLGFLGHQLSSLGHSIADAARGAIGRGEDYASEARSYYRKYRPSRAKQHDHGGKLGYLGHYLSDLGHDIADRARSAASRGRSYAKQHLPRRREPETDVTTLLLTAAGCALLGAGLMYLLDPDAGRRRRARVRDKMIRAGHAAEEYARDTGRYMSDRARGLASETRARFRHEDVPDHTLVERVRERALSHRRPGSYQLIVTLSDGEEDVTVQQDFTWGVLVMNVDKSTYTPKELVRIGMAVLNDAGRTLCDAALALHVTTPGGAHIPITDIAVSEECADKSVTDLPDYMATFLPDEAGEYTITLTAETENGSRTLRRSFEVTNDAPFVVRRGTATRIYPPADYTVRLTITAAEDFTGDIVEPIPSSFVIRDVSNDGVVQGNTVVWPNSTLRAGDRVELSYVYDAPNISPEFYTLGPLELTGAEGQQWQEPRRWQIAADALVHWTGGGSTDNWSDCDNWGGTCPGSDDVAIFSSTSTKDAVIDTNVNILGIDIQSGYTGTITQNAGVTITLGTGNYNQADGTFQGGDSTITINGRFTMS